MAINFYKETNTFKLDTAHTTYAFCVSECGVLEHLYYGKRVKDADLRYIGNRQRYTFAFYDENSEKNFAESTVLNEYSSFNSADFRVPSCDIENSDGTRGNRFKYKSHEIFKGRKEIDGMPFSRADNAENVESLAVVITDAEKGVDIELNYTVFPEEDVIARFNRIINNSDGDIYIYKAASLCLDFYGADFDLIQLDGMYLYERAAVSRNPLRKGVQSIGSLLGTPTHHQNQFFALCTKNADENLGEAYGFNLLYSGNFLNEVEVDRLSDTRVISGINPTGLRCKVAKGGAFDTPEAVMTYSDNGIGGMSRNFHDHIRNNIIERRYLTEPRPVVINSWETYYFDVDEEKILKLADSAKEVGADTVVLDDGWFRDDNRTGLGDWKTSRVKFPNGIKVLAEKIHDKGLKFGIWIEPEMVAKLSELYEKEPDKILHTRPDAYLWRNQFVLDLTDGETVEYIFNRITDEFGDSAIDYIKWDANRYITQAGSAVTPSGEVYHRQVLGFYKLMRLFKEKYPNAILESCSGGGGRFDAGVLSFSPQIWTSDNTDPYARAYIQYGTSIAYPASCMSCHFTEGVCTSGRPSTPEFRYLVSSFGAYGYEFDISALSEKDKAKLKEYSALYRETEKFVLNGDLYRLISPESDKFSAYMQVLKDKSAALFTFLHINSTGFYENIMLKLKGLDENRKYKNSATGEVLSGGALMNVGLRIKDLFKGKSGRGFKLLFTAVE